jgi:hypothetical protein
MEMKKTLKYIFSYCVISLLIVSAHSQTTRIKGLRIGYDVSRLSLYYFEPERTSFEVSADIETSRNLYPTFEYGQEEFNKTGNLQNSNYNYKSKGYYYRLGLDYNFLKAKESNKYDMLFLGLRYGTSLMNQVANNISVLGGYWGDYTGGEVPKSTLKAYWIEAVLGLRTELFKNFFMGWSVRGRVILKKSNDPYMDPFFIPGFGKGNKWSGFGFNYSLYYRIPIWKEKQKPENTKKEK